MPISPPVDGQPGATSWAEAVTDLVNDYDANGATAADLAAERLFDVPSLTAGSGAAAANATAIAAAIIAAAGKAVYIRDGTWHFDTAPTIPGGTSFVMGPQAVLRFTGAGPAIIFDGWTVTHSARVVLGKIQRTSRTWYSTDSTSVGARLRNSSFMTIEIDEISDFCRGLEFLGDAAGTAYNTVRLGRIINNKIGIDYTTVNGGWTNENHVHGGAVRIDGGLAEIPATTLSSGVTLPVATIPVVSTTGFPSSGSINVAGTHVAYTGKTSNTFTGATGGVGAISNGAAVSEVVAGTRYVDLSDATANGNTLDQTTLEGSVPEISVDFGGDDNALVFCRQEQSSPIRFQSGATGNFVVGGFGNYGPGSSHFQELNVPPRNRIIGSRGDIVFSDSTGTLTGGKAGVEGHPLNSDGDVIWRSRNLAGQITGEWLANGRRKLYSGGQSYPRVADDTTGISGFGGTFYGRGDIEPDSGIGRVSGSQAGLMTNCPLIKNVYAYSSSGSPVVVDAALAEIYRVSASGDFNWAIGSGVQDGQTVAIEFKQDGTGSRVVGFSFATNVSWIGAAAPVLSTGANRLDVVHLRWDATAVKWVEWTGRAVNVG